MYNDLFTRSFSKHEQKKLSLWAFVGCFIMALSFCALLNSHMSPLPPLNFQLTSNFKLKVFSIIDTFNDQEDGRDAILIATNASNPASSTPVKEVVQVNEVVDQVQVIKKLPSLICNFSLPRSDFCDINGDVRIQGNSSVIISPTLFVDNVETNNITTWRLRPYARKQDGYVMTRVRELILGSPSSFGLNEMPKCSVNHTVPAIVLSNGGYAGNTFHDFSDILVPLYITSRQYNGEVQFMVTDMMPFWFIKYKTYLDALSNYNVIDMDNSKEVHCFPSMMFGLQSHKELGIEPSLTKQGYSMRSFTKFVRSAYSLNRTKVDPIGVGKSCKPRLLIISRKRSRSIVNEDEVANEARRLGYEVSIMDARLNLRDFSKIVNSFDVMVGVHGAGMTNSVFLPENAVLIQVVPLGLEWLSKTDFERPARAMNLRYLDYKISGKESTLSNKFPLEHPLIQNPTSIKDQGFLAFKKMFLDGQNVRIDVSRFRNTLLKALELLRE